MHYPVPNTLQGFFDKAYELVVEQGRASYHPDSGCLYRGPDNTKCAIGFFMSDEYAMKADAKTIAGKDLDIYPNEAYRALAILIQNAHDDSAQGNDNESFIIEFKDRMKHVAAVSGLKVPD